MSDFDELDLLTRELRRRSEDVDGHPLDLDGVRRRARSIHRRRQVLGGAVAAVLASVAVPTGLALTHGTGEGPVKHPPVATSPSITPTPRADGTFLLTTKDLPRGAEPSVPYVRANGPTLVTPDGAVDLPKPYTQITRVNGGWMAVDNGPGGEELLTLDPDMSVLRRQPGGPFALDRHGSRVLYALRDDPGAGDRSVVDAPVRPTDPEDAASWPAPRDSTVVPVGYVAQHTVVYQTEGEKPVVAMGTPDGRSVPLQGFLKVESASDANGLVAGMVSYENGSSCSGVMDPQSSTTKLLWRTCRYSLHEFSPDGRFVIAGSTSYDAWGSPSLTILDAHTGDPLAELRPRKDVPLGVAQTTWEDDDTVLADVVEADRMTMVRVELSGRLEAATDSTGTLDETLPFWFAEPPNR